MYTHTHTCAHVVTLTTPRTKDLVHNVTVELHGCSVDSALRRVRAELETAQLRGGAWCVAACAYVCQVHVTGVTQMKVITGKGRHSVSNVAALLPAVKRLLTEHGVPSQELDHGGGLFVCVRQPAPLHLLL